MWVYTWFGRCDRRSESFQSTESGPGCSGHAPTQSGGSAAVSLSVLRVPAAASGPAGGLLRVTQAAVRLTAGQAGPARGCPELESESTVGTDRIACRMGHRDWQAWVTSTVPLAA